MVNRYTMLDEFIERISAVTPADIQRVSQTYLVSSNCTVGWFEPTPPGAAADGSPSPVAAIRRSFDRAPA